MLVFMRSRAVYLCIKVSCSSCSSITCIFFFPRRKHPLLLIGLCEIKYTVNNTLPLKCPLELLIFLFTYFCAPYSKVYSVKSSKLQAATWTIIPLSNLPQLISSSCNIVQFSCKLVQLNGTEVPDELSPPLKLGCLRIKDKKQT